MRFYILLFVMFTQPIHAFGSNPAKGGKAIPISDIYNMFTTAPVVDDGNGWCTPAIQIGPRVFITAAHCADIFLMKKYLHVVGKNIKQVANFKAISYVPGLTDETAFSSPDCKLLFDGLAQGAILSLDQMKICWANNGQPDIALLIVDKEIPGQMVSVATTPNTIGDPFVLLGYTPQCAGNPIFFRASRFKSFGLTNEQIVFDGSGMGFTDLNSSACGGESGGGYLRQSSSGLVELAAIHSGGSNENHLNVTLYGKDVQLHPFFAGGTDLTTATVQTWLLSTIEAEGVSICGINLFCKDSPKWPF